MIPLFKSAYTFKSILSLDDKSDTSECSPSIVNIAKKHDLEKVFLVEDNMASFLEAKKKLGDKLIFGLRLTFCNDINEENNESDCKYIIFANNEKGYYKLINIFSFAGIEGKYKDNPRIDFKNFNNFWDDKSLTLAIPFYDSFIHKNISTFSKCVHPIDSYNPVFFEEDNGLFEDSIIRDALYKFLEGTNFEVEKVKSIYYEFKNEFLAWQTYKCIQNRSTLDTPNLGNCASDEFCFESYLENK